MDKRQEDKEFLAYLVESTHETLLRDGKYSMLLYPGYAIIEHFLFPPEIYLKTWLVRLVVCIICGLLLVFARSKHPLMLRHRRLLFLFSLSLVLNSVTVIYYLSYPTTLPSNVSLAALTLLIVMSTFPMLAKDAMSIGAIFLVGFATLLATRNVDETTWYIYIIALGTAYVAGASAAVLGENHMRRAFKQDRSLREERNRADSLLTKTFPKEVAKELKLTDKSPARRFENATVMFCDIVDFTHTSAQLDPEKLVDSLNHIFSTLDRLATEHGCEKIKTVGDAYMAACGVPSPCMDHADRILNLALAIQDATKGMTLNGKPVRLRIGINSGPVVAGVIGENRFAYDLWGDTVNTASRMESLAAPGRIQITEATRAMLSAPVKLEKVQGLAVKGKGTMDAWLVSSAHPLEKPAPQKDAA